MTKEALVQKTLQALSQLPTDKVKEISDFAEFLLKQLDDQILKKGMTELVSNSDSFDFLKEEEELYSINDLKGNLNP